MTIKIIRLYERSKSVTTSTVESEEITFYRNGLKFLNYRPSLLIALLWFFPLFYVYYFSDYEIERLTFYSFFVIGLVGAVYAENFWVKSINSNKKAARIMYSRVQPYRMMFVGAGIISSILMMLVSLFMIYTMIYYINFRFVTGTKYTGRALSWFYLLLTILLSFNLSYVYGATFFQLRSHSLKDGRIKFYFNSPKQIISLITYFILGWFIPLSILWVGEVTGGIQILQNGDRASLLVVDQILYGSGGLFVVLTSSTILGLVFSARQIPHFLHKQEFNYLKLIKNRHVAMKNVGIIIFLEILGLVSLYLPLVGSNVLMYLHLLVYALPAILIVYLFNTTELSSSYCSTCGFVKENDNCEICADGAISMDLPVDIPQIGRIKHPRCPNCRKIWDNLSRQCNNCQYTIILSCENCSQTLNPLWRECNRCGKERVPIPVKAMSVPSSKTYSVNRGKLMYLFLFFLFLTLTSGIRWIYRLNQRNVGYFEFENFVYPGRDIALFVLAIVSMVFLGYLIYQSYQSEKKGMSLIISFLVFYPITYAYLNLLVFLIMFLPTNILEFSQGVEGQFDFGGFVLVIIVIIISGLLLYLLVRRIVRNYQSSRNTIITSSDIIEELNI